MAIDWLDVSSLSFNTLLLLERVQLSWFPGWLPEPELAIALKANPAVEWYMRHKCPQLNPWLDDVMVEAGESQPQDKVRQAEEAILRTINDLVTYAVDPAVYDALPFMKWDTQELTSLVDFADKTVIDVGAGTGRLSIVVAQTAVTVFAVEPVANLRQYLKDKAREQGLKNVYPIDGLITDLPFPAAFADVTMAGHVFGDSPAQEYQELARVTRPGGRVILCPGGVDRDTDAHAFLASQGFQWSRLEEPGEGWMRKYWKRV